MTRINDFTFDNEGFLYVTALMNGGSELLKFDATTGAFVQQLAQITDTNTIPLGTLVVQTPEPSGITIFCLALLVRRRTWTIRFRCHG